MTIKDLRKIMKPDTLCEVFEQVNSVKVLQNISEIPVQADSFKVKKLIELSEDIYYIEVEEC